MSVTHTNTSLVTRCELETRVAVRDKQPFRGVCAVPEERQLLGGFQKARLLSLIQLNPTTGKLFTVIYSSSAPRL